MKFNLLFHKNSFIEVYLVKQDHGRFKCGTKLWKGKKLAVSVGDNAEIAFNKSLNHLFIEEQIR
ncbi:type IV secretory pathway VirB9-like protein [Peribacillus deserti]|uniref:Type IV secretory pathway VirB9-like protein n=1 Tax=Peribacillus deserti TaxID=673318 RepID=A0ABS2QF31_9BACI|nr:hypothetical protein [Peribacillus deserti]MBM7691761.1 type IV secretory pathway VirB9-like protein [Peribacillus deserti]